MPYKNEGTPAGKLIVYRKYSMFKGYERTFKAFEYTFKGFEYTFAGVEHRIHTNLFAFYIR